MLVCVCAHICVHYPHKTDTRLTASFPGQPGQPGTRKFKPIWILIEAGDDRVASAEPYTNHLQLASDR